ncbi:MBL fold metallo-hydrolase [Sediminibacillus dalangtanensis]|uniref:MBL fold metallo-hydrolase n=1 Tax=Sediminibacillus dalangtanensis TaxID=2729421 RepID=A0ABX7VSD1_9BACI|nr:MBL fold metallo-hydrolase [Sediminibacillus dalangtanensis]QTM98710.1 MBL fold metallo-hydrolase [Sediminibacillus dalangtanensis]
MEFQPLKEGTCYYFEGPVNIGYLRNGEEGMLIDAGIDASTMKKVLKWLKQEELPLTHLFITHAHSDHYGGANYLQSRQGVHTAAPVLEAAILQYPILEPLYLFGGNDPLPELRNKFLEGAPIQIDQMIDEGFCQIGSFAIEAILLPGHSYHQLGLLYQEIFYAGDSYFGEKQLEKHGIPYLTDTQLAMDSLHKLKGITCQGAVPGHGTYEENFQSTVQSNFDYHEQLLEWLEEEIGKKPDGMSHEDVIASMCANYHVRASQLSQWLLFRTAVTAYLTALLKQNRITSEIKDYRWFFKVLR